MLGRFKRKLSRTKSVAVEAESYTDPNLKRTLTLTPADEQFISRLTFTDDTNLDGRHRPRTAPSLYSHVSGQTHSTERTVFNNVESGILSLPAEVLLTFGRYLSPSGEVSLRNTCSRFFNLFNTPSFYLSGDDQFDWFCMNERDQDPEALDRLVCGHCREFHPKAAFPAAERKLDPINRDCRQIWLCAHKHLGYQKTQKTIKAGHEAPFRSENLESCSRCRDVIRNRSVAERLGKGTSDSDLDSDNAMSLLVTKIALLQAPAPNYSEKAANGSSSYKEVFSVKSVADTLGAIDFPICNHVNLSDPYLLSRFCRACINTQKLPDGVKGPPCISEQKRDFGDPEYLGKCKQSCYTRGCRTRFMYQARESLAPDASGRRQVWLILAIYRWLGPLQSESEERRRDQLWLSHAATHSTRTEMRTKWETLEKSNRRGRPMPNWSICNLHPEDPSVRMDQTFQPYKVNSPTLQDALKGVVVSWRK